MLTFYLTKFEWVGSYLYYTAQIKMLPNPTHFKVRLISLALEVHGGDFFGIQIMRVEDEYNEQFTQ